MLLTLAAFGIVAQDYANIRAALSWSLEGVENLSEGIRTATKMHWFWNVRGHFRKARQWYDRFLAADLSTVEPEIGARILCGAGMLAGEAADYATAIRWLEESLAIACENALETETAYALQGIGLVALDRADFERGQAVFEESLSISRRNGVQGQITSALLNLAEIRLGLGNPGQYVSANGLSFTDANMTSWNLFTQGLYTLENSVGSETIGDISITPAATPEPSTLLVSVAGLGVFALRRRRNRA